jgi:hypothetical protein
MSNRAEQLKLQQQTNQELIHIRKIQLNYYINLYSALSIQAVIICYFGYVDLSQAHIDHNNYEYSNFLFIFYIFESLCIASTTHLLSCTLLIQIFGPRLALYGKLGSITQTIKSMRLEQNQIIICFMFMMISFAIMTVLSFWVTMEFAAATSCTIIIFISSLFWYSSCERIYLRFYWNQEDIDWSLSQRNSDTTSNGGDCDLNDDDDEPRLNVLFPSNAFIDNSKTSNPLHSNKDQRKGWNFLSLVSSSSSTRSSPSSSSMSIELIASSNSKRSVVISEGYLSNKRASSNIISGKITMKSMKWKRQYFVLFDNGYIYTYKKRIDYRNDKTLLKYTRPIILNDNRVKVIVSTTSDNNTILRDSEFSESKSERSITSSISSSLSSTMMSTFASTEIDMSNISVNTFMFSIMSNRNDSYDRIDGNSSGDNVNGWVLSCDTEEELLIWIDCLQKISPTSFE